MLVRRRLYHCSRCLYADQFKPPNLPLPTKPEPRQAINPGSLPPVSLPAWSTRKVPARKWIPKAPKEELLDRYRNGFVGFPPVPGQGIYFPNCYNMGGNG